MSVSFSVGQVYTGSSRNYKERRTPHSSNARLHWTAKHKWNTAWKDAVWEQIMMRRRRFGPLPYKRAHITFVLFTVRFLDTDNSYTAIKPLLDALKGRVIVDDSPVHIELTVFQAKVEHRDEERVSVTVEDLSDDDSD